MKKLITSLVLMLMLVIPVVLATGCVETKFTVTFNAHGGTTVASITKKKDATIETQPASAKDGYTLDGWFTEETGGTKFVFGEQGTKITADITLHAQWTYQPTSQAVETGFTVNSWTIGDPNVGPEAEFDIVDGIVVVTVADGTAFIQLDIAEFLSGKDIQTITRNDLDGAIANVFTLDEMNTGSGTETWNGAGYEGKTTAEIEDDDATATVGAIFVYPELATWVYFGDRTSGLTEGTLVDGETFEVVFTATNGDTYTLTIEIAIA